jgi:hypothetical protein
MPYLQEIFTFVILIATLAISKVGTVQHHNPFNAIIRWALSITLILLFLNLIFNPGSTSPQSILWILLLLFVNFDSFKSYFATQQRKTPFLVFFSIMIFLLITISILELGSRTIYWLRDTTPISNYFSHPIRLYHPDRIYTLAPNTTLTLQTSEGIEWSISISEQGLRNNKIAPKRNKEFRILLIGDSFAFGFGLPDDKVLSARLENCLKDQNFGPDVCVINGGVSGYGAWQELSLLRELTPLLKPDLVIHQLFPFNDVDDALKRVGKHLRAHNREDQIGFLPFLYQSYPQVRCDLWLQKHSYAYALLLTTLKRQTGIADIINLLPGFENADYESYLPSENRIPYIEINLKKSYPELEEGWSLYAEDILNTWNFCRSSGIDYLTLPIPELSTVSNSAWHELIKNNNALYYDQTKGITRLQDMLDKLNIPYFNLYSIICEHNQPETLYFPKNRHLNDLGTALTAELLCEYLSKAHSTLSLTE